MADYREIEVTIEDGVGTIRFDRVEKRNALCMPLFEDVVQALDAFKDDDDVAVVVFTGGEEVFAAGLDLDDLLHHNADEQDLHNEATYAFYRRIIEYPKPTIAALAGPVVGGGSDIAIFCDVRIASDNTVISIPQIRFGMTTFIDPLWRLCGPGWAKILLFTGDTIDAQRAKEIGYVDVVVSEGTVVAEAQKLAKRMARNGTRLLQTFKEQSLYSPPDVVGQFVYAHALFRDVSRGGAMQEKVAQFMESMKQRATA